MRFYLYLGLLLGAVMTGVAGWMWWVQNSSHTVELSFRLTRNLAWKLDQPVQLPILMAICMGVGFGGGAVLFLGRSMRMSAENRRLRQQATLSGSSSSGSEW